MIPKFRAWDKITNQMRGCYGFNDMELEVYVCSVADDEFNGRPKTVHALKRSFDEVVIMQSTGLKDKNGVEIFEGDIVNVTQYFGGHSFGQLPYVVKKSEYNNNLMLILQSKQRFIPGKSLNFSRSEDYEVIGNIYKNPGLLEAVE